MRLRFVILLVFSLFASSQCQNIAGVLQRRMVGFGELDEATELDESSRTRVGAPLFYELLALAETEDLGEECAQDIRRVVASLELLKINSSVALASSFTRKVALPVLDSSGKPEPGLMKGAVVFHGHYTECTAIDYPMNDGDRRFKADFMRFHIDAFNRTCSSVRNIGIDVCMPVTCRAADVENYMDGLPGNVSSLPFCRVVGLRDVALPYDTAYYVVLSLVCTIAGFCVVSGIVDYFFSSYVERTCFASSLPWQLFLAFSFYRNAQSILETKSVNKSGQIGTLHCMRFFSMCWVISGHSFVYYGDFASNAYEMLPMANDLPTEIILNSYFAVDTFFFISGLLVAFIWFKIYYKNPRATNSPTAWLMYYVHRILRLSPAYFIMIIFYTFTFHQFLNNQPSSMSLQYPSDNDKCRKNWYLNLLYLNNYVNYNEYCLPQSWYLSTDMQIFLFTPLLLVPLALKPVIGLAVAAVAFSISTAANIYTVYAYHYKPPGLFPNYPDMTNDAMMKYEELMYAAPYIRCQIYIMGMVVGWALQRYKRISIHPVLNVSGWAVGGALMLTILFGLYGANRLDDPVILSLFLRAMYSAWSRPAWGLGLSWIIISCFYGYGGPLNRFMSWSLWAPLGRISYCGYLVHYPVLEYLTGLSYDGYYFTNFTEAFVTRFLPYIVITFPVAFIWSCCFELSFGKVEMLLLGGLRAGGGAEKEKREEAEIKGDDDEESREREEEGMGKAELYYGSEEKRDPSIEVGREKGSLVGN